MGASYQEPPTIPQDLKVNIQKSFMVFPSQKTTRKSIFLSNIDQVLNFDVQTVHFFAAHRDYPFHRVAATINNALEKLLVPYSFMAGRVKINPETHRLEIDCNDAGAGFVVASSECTLDDVGDLVYPNPAFEQLVTKSMDHLENDDHPLCIFQVTSFKCGGFVMGMSTNHTTMDGLSVKTFLENLAALAGEKPLAVTPCNDRKLLAARSPPQVTFSHPEMIKLNTHLGQDTNAPVFDATQEKLDFQIFRLTSTDVSKLKELSKTIPDDQTRVSGFNVVTAHVWRCKALSYDVVAGQQDLDRVSTILYAVNIRPRLVPPLPESYVGNAVLTAYASAKCRDLKEEPMSRLVKMVEEGSKRMNDEYARSVIDWGEINKGFPHGEFLLSSWWRLGFDQVEYPWGSPKYCCPVVYHRKDIILLFPDIDDKNGVNVLAALPSKEMDKFRSLFHEFLSG